MRYCLVIFLALFISNVHAKRMAPPTVKPVVVNGVKYELIKWGYKMKMRQNGGILKATNIKTKEVLWTKLIYKTQYTKGRETDLQDVFVKKLVLSDDQKSLIATDERNQSYQVDLKTGEAQPLKK